MKPSLLPILLLLFLSESLSFGQKADYYWYGNSKRNLVEDTTQLLVELKNSDNAVFSKLKSVSGYRNQRIKKGGNIQIILRNNPETKEAIRTLNPIFKSYAMTIFGEVSPAFIADEISVKFIQSPQAISNFEDKYGLKLVKVTSYGAYIFKVVNDKLTLQTANRIKENESVEWSSPDFVSIIVKHNDPLFPDQYYLNNTGQFGGTSGIDIRAVQAWQITYGCNNVRVAVVDDGVDNHEDFSGRVVSGYTVGNNTNGAPVNTCDATHGVMCAGIIAATHNNGMGIRGVAPNTIVVPINIFPDGLAGQVATDSEIAEAVDWAWQSNKGNADIISMSFGATTIQYDLQSVISTARTNGRGGKGTIFVASSGNRGSQGITSPGNIDGVITVGAVDKSGNIWSYSGRGSSLDVVAPAGETTGGFEDCTPLSGDVRTTDRMGGNGTESGNYTTGFGGTSAACPQVAGIAALMISINPNLTEVQVTSILQQTARDLGSPGFDNDYGHGLVNAEKALNAIFPISGPSILTCYTASNYSVSTPSGYSYFWSVMGIFSSPAILA